MHRYPMEPVEKIEKMPADEQAEIAAYRTLDGELMVPAIAMQRCLVSAATFSKGKGRSSLQRETASSVFVSPEHIGLGQRKYEVDARPVVIPATKGRIVRYRPKLSDWNLKFQIEYDETLLTEIQLRRIVDDAGQRVGLLDFRPEKKGPFGRFIVTKWSK
jgi:hypothetical protein